MISSPLKWHGGKAYLAKKIVALMPPHIHYVEPFFGGGSVLLAKDPEGVSEVVNDLNADLMTFWRTIRDQWSFQEFERLCKLTPFSETDWHYATAILNRQVDAENEEFAWAFFVSCRQSLAGRMAAFAPLSKTRTRRGMNEQASAWISAIEGLPEVHERLRRVVITDRPALEAIRGEDAPGTLFYLDPPYLHETRASKGTYAHEMSEADHCELLNLIRDCKGKVMISGYPSKLYDSTLNDWSRHTFEISNHAAGGKTKRRMTEVLWCKETHDA